MYDAVCGIAALGAFWVFSLLTFLRLWAGNRRLIVMARLSEIGSIDSVSEEDEDDILRLPLFDRTLKPGLKWIAVKVGQVTPAGALKKIEEKLVKAGSPRKLKAGDFLTIQGVSGIAGLLAGIALVHFSAIDGVRIFAVPVLTAGAGAYVPWFWLSQQVTQRQKEIRQDLPDIMDFLVVCLEAGLSFDLALMRVVEKFKGEAGDEFARALREIQLGKNRKEALRDMADRVGIEELSFLVNAVLQAEQLGVGMAQVLHIQSDLLRDKRQQHIEEQAMKAPVKMLFPLIFFIFPSIFIVVLGPAILNILASLGGQ
ncbi:MAG TPA: type II secretion system F family protein [Firmicutes bacterium]|nr:type II secretion system F family protein [Candidatus Fermentithermobacillaceae bacterium]